MSRTILCAVTRTNCPRTKYTPSSTFAAEPVAVAEVACNVAEDEFATIPPTTPFA